MFLISNPLLIVRTCGWVIICDAEKIVQERFHCFYISTSFALEYLWVVAYLSFALRHTPSAIKVIFLAYNRQEEIEKQTAKEREREGKHHMWWVSLNSMLFCFFVYKRLNANTLEISNCVHHVYSHIVFMHIWSVCKPVSVCLLLWTMCGNCVCVCSRLCVCVCSCETFFLRLKFYPQTRNWIFFIISNRN